MAGVHLSWYNGSFEEKEDKVLGSLLLGVEKEEDDTEGVEFTDAELIKKKEQEIWWKIHKETKYPKSLRVP